MPAVVASVLAFMVLVLALLGGIAVAIVKIIKGKNSSTPDDSEEAKVIQEVHQGLQRMEQRIEALETILLERNQEQAKAKE